MPRTTDTRQRLLDAARDLFWERGYAATGLAEILHRARANSGSFYFFFSSKEALLEAVLDWYLENIGPALLDPAYAKSRDPMQRIFALLEGYRGKILATNFAFGCPIGRLALEMDPGRRAVREKIAENFSAWTGAVRLCLEQAGDRLPRDLDRAALAQLVLTVMEGGVMQSRAHQDIAPFDASVRQLRDYLRRLEAEGKHPVRRKNAKRKRRSK